MAVHSAGNMLPHPGVVARSRNDRTFHTSSSTLDRAKTLAFIIPPDQQGGCQGPRPRTARNSLESARFLATDLARILKLATQVAELIETEIRERDGGAFIPRGEAHFVKWNGETFSRDRFGGFSDPLAA